MTPQQYLSQRLSQLGYSQPPSFTITVPMRDGEDITHTRLFFEAVDEGIKINYYELNGTPATYTKERTRQKSKSLAATIRPKTTPDPEDLIKADFYRIRYTEEISKQKGHKYGQPYQSGQMPWLPPTIIEKYRAKTPIERLIIVEGEFKAAALSNAGIDAVAISGIHAYGDAETKDKETQKTTLLHPVLVELLHTCQVQNVLLIFDADAKHLNFDPEKGETKNWAVRPQLFYAAAFRFAQMMLPCMAQTETGAGVKKIRLKIVKRQWLTIAKGVDDLLLALPAEKEAILNEVNLLQAESNYFEAINITDTPKDAKPLKSFFGTQSAKNFYETYQNELLGYPFRRFRQIYQAQDGYPIMISDDDGQRFIRIGPKWFKRVEVYNAFNEIEEELKPWPKEEIKEDYGHIPGFMKSLSKYDTFVNVPCFTPDYAREINGNYNIANPLPHIPKPGNFGTIASFLCHIFSGDTADISANKIIDREGTPLTVFVDWLTVALRHPMQKLIVPVLVSKENKTGKTTLLDFVAYLFGTNNAAILNNDRFKTRFNAHYISKHIIGIDEGFLDADKKSEKEGLKQLVTSKTQYIEFKGVNLERVMFYGKIIMTSNDETRVMKIDDVEDRWFVVKVPQFATENPNILEDMRNEIPAFLAYLFTRKICHPHETRFWFAKKHYLTKQFGIIVESTKTALEKNIDEKIKFLFLLIKPEEEELIYDVKFIIDALAGETAFKTDANHVRTYIKEKRNCPKLPVKYYAMPKDLSFNAASEEGLRPVKIGGSDNPDIIYEKRNCSPFLFKAKEWLKPHYYEALYQNNLPTTQPEIVPKPDTDMPF